MVTKRGSIRCDHLINWWKLHHFWLTLGGALASLSHRPRCLSIFSITCSSSMKLNILIDPEHLGHVNGSTSYIFWMRRAQFFLYAFDDPSDSRMEGYDVVLILFFPPTATHITVKSVVTDPAFSGIPLYQEHENTWQRAIRGHRRPSPPCRPLIGR